MSQKKYRKGRPDKQVVIVSIERYICLQAIVHTMRQSRKPSQRIKTLLQNLKEIEIHDFVKG